MYPALVFLSMQWKAVGSNVILNSTNFIVWTKTVENLIKTFLVPQKKKLTFEKSNDVRIYIFLVKGKEYTQMLINWFVKKNSFFFRIWRPRIHCKIPNQNPWIQFQVCHLQWQQNNGGKCDHIHYISKCIIYLKQMLTELVLVKD